MRVNNLYCTNCINFKLFNICLVTKLFALLSFIVFAIFNNYLIFTFIYFLLLLILLRIAGFKYSIWFKSLVNLWYLDLLVILIAILSFNIESFFMIFLNFQILFSFIFFIYLSTSSNELRKVILSFFVPLNKLNVNTYKLSDICVNIINFIPEYTLNVSKIYNSEKSRGVDILSVDLKTKFIALVNVYKNGYKLTIRNMYRRKKIKDFMLYDKNKKISPVRKTYSFIDFLIILLHIGILVLLIFQEEVNYEIFTKFFL